MTTTQGRRDWDKLNTVASAPGYSDAGLQLTLSNGQRVEINLKPEDVAYLLTELNSIKRHAWNFGRE